MPKDKNKYYVSLEELYLDNYELIYMIICDYFEPGTQIAEDISQEVWIKVAEQPKKYLKMNAYWISNYLRIMTRNLIFDYLKNSSKENGKVIQERKEFKNTNDSLFLVEDIFYEDEVNFLEKAMDVLSENEKYLIYLRFYENLSAKQIGEMLDLSEGAVRVRQLRILKKLRKELLKIMSEEEAVE